MLSPAKLRKALMQIDAQIAAMKIIENQFTIGFADSGQVPDAVIDAWNAAHDAVRTLEEERAEVESNPRPIPPNERGTWALVQQNID